MERKQLMVMALTGIDAIVTSSSISSQPVESEACKLYSKLTSSECTESSAPSTDWPSKDKTRSIDHCVENTVADVLNGAASLDSVAISSQESIFANVAIQLTLPTCGSDEHNDSKEKLATDPGECANKLLLKNSIQPGHSVELNCEAATLSEGVTSSNLSVESRASQESSERALVSVAEGASKNNTLDNSSIREQCGAQEACVNCCRVICDAENAFSGSIAVGDLDSLLHNDAELQFSGVQPGSHSHMISSEPSVIHVVPETEGHMAVSSAFVNDISQMNSLSDCESNNTSFVDSNYGCATKENNVVDADCSDEASKTATCCAALSSESVEEDLVLNCAPVMECIVEESSLACSYDSFGISETSLSFVVGDVMENPDVADVTEYANEDIKAESRMPISNPVDLVTVSGDERGSCGREEKPTYIPDGISQVASDVTSRTADVTEGAIVSDMMNVNKVNDETGKVRAEHHCTTEGIPWGMVSEENIEGTKIEIVKTCSSDATESPQGKNVAEYSSSAESADVDLVEIGAGAECVNILAGDTTTANICEDIVTNLDHGRFGRLSAERFSPVVSQSASASSKNPCILEAAASNWTPTEIEMTSVSSKDSKNSAKFMDVSALLSDNNAATIQLTDELLIDRDASIPGDLSSNYKKLTDSHSDLHSPDPAEFSAVDKSAIAVNCAAENAADVSLVNTQQTSGPLDSSAACTETAASVSLNACKQRELGVAASCSDDSNSICHLKNRTRIEKQATSCSAVISVNGLDSVMARQTNVNKSVIDLPLHARSEESMPVDVTAHDFCPGCKLKDQVKCCCNNVTSLLCEGLETGILNSIDHIILHEGNIASSESVNTSDNGAPEKDKFTESVNPLAKIIQLVAEMGSGSSLTSHQEAVTPAPCNTLGGQPVPLVELLPETKPASSFEKISFSVAPPDIVANRLKKKVVGKNFSLLVQSASTTTAVPPGISSCLADNHAKLNRSVCKVKPKTFCCVKTAVPQRPMTAVKQPKSFSHAGFAISGTGSSSETVDSSMYESIKNASFDTALARNAKNASRKIVKAKSNASGGFCDDTAELTHSCSSDSLLNSNEELTSALTKPKKWSKYKSGKLTITRRSVSNMVARTETAGDSTLTGKSANCCSSAALPSNNSSLSSETTFGTQLLAAADMDMNKSIEGSSQVTVSTHSDNMADLKQKVSARRKRGGADAHNSKLTINKVEETFTEPLAVRELPSCIVDHVVICSAVSAVSLDTHPLKKSHADDKTCNSESRVTVEDGTDKIWELCEANNSVELTDSYSLAGAELMSGPAADSTAAVSDDVGTVACDNSAVSVSKVKKAASNLATKRKKKKHSEGPTGKQSEIGSVDVSVSLNVLDLDREVNEELVLHKTGLCQPTSQKIDELFPPTRIKRKQKKKSSKQQLLFASVQSTAALIANESDGASVNYEKSYKIAKRCKKNMKLVEGALDLSSGKPNAVLNEVEERVTPLHETPNFNLQYGNGSTARAANKMIDPVQVRCEYNCEGKKSAKKARKRLKKAKVTSVLPCNSSTDALYNGNSVCRETPHLCGYWKAADDECQRVPMKNVNVKYCKKNEVEGQNETVVNEILNQQSTDCSGKKTTDCETNEETNRGSFSVIVKKKQTKKITRAKSSAVQHIHHKELSTELSRPDEKDVTDLNADKPFACPSCGYRSNKKGQLRKHLSVHLVFACAHCCFVGSSHNVLENHMIHAHPSRCGRRLCKRCHMLFRTDDGAFTEHEQLCTGEKFIWKCSFCCKQFKFVSALKTHIRRWHTRPTEVIESHEKAPVQNVTAAVDQIIAASCDGNPATAAAADYLLADHQPKSSLSDNINEQTVAKILAAANEETAIAANSGIGVDRRFKCTHCDKTFKARRSMVHHRRMVHEGGQLLKQHMKLGKALNTVGDALDFRVGESDFNEIETGSGGIQGACDHSVESKSFPVDNNAMKLELKSIDFSACSSNIDIQLFTDPDSMQSGTLNDKSTEVDGCGMPPGDELDVSACNETSNSQKGKRPTVFVCNFAGCLHTFKRPGQLHRHEERHASPDEKTFRCDWPDCRKRFLYAQNMLAHRRQHVDPKPYRCDRCPLAYWQKSSLRSHQSKAHGSFKDSNSFTIQVNSDDKAVELASCENSCAEPLEQTDLKACNSVEAVAKSPPKENRNVAEKMDILGTDYCETKELCTSGSFVAEISVNADVSWSDERAANSIIHLNSIKPTEHFSADSAAGFELALFAESSADMIKSGRSFKAQKNKNHAKKKWSRNKGTFDQAAVCKTGPLGGDDDLLTAAIDICYSSAGEANNATDSFEPSVDALTLRNQITSLACCKPNTCSNTLKPDVDHSAPYDVEKKMNIYEFCEEECVDIQTLKSSRVGTATTPRVSTHCHSTCKGNDTLALTSNNSTQQDMPKSKKKKFRQRETVNHDSVCFVPVNHLEICSSGSSVQHNENDDKLANMQDNLEESLDVLISEADREVKNVTAGSSKPRVEFPSKKTGSLSRRKRRLKMLVGGDKDTPDTESNNKANSKAVAGRKRSAFHDILTTRKSTEIVVKRQKTLAFPWNLQHPLENIQPKPECVTHKGAKSMRVKLSKSKSNKKNVKCNLKAVSGKSARRKVKSRRAKKVKSLAFVETRSKSRFLNADSENKITVSSAKDRNNIQLSTRKATSVCGKLNRSSRQQKKRLVVAAGVENSFLPGTSMKFARRKKGKKRRRRVAVTYKQVNDVKDVDSNPHSKKQKLLETDEVRSSSTVTEITDRMENEIVHENVGAVILVDKIKEKTVRQENVTSEFDDVSVHQKGDDDGSSVAGMVALQGIEVNVDQQGHFEGVTDEDSSDGFCEIHDDIDIMPPAPAAPEVISDVESQESPGKPAPVQSPRRCTCDNGISELSMLSTVGSQSPRKLCSSEGDGLQQPDAQDAVSDSTYNGQLKYKCDEGSLPKLTGSDEQITVTSCESESVVPDVERGAVSSCSTLGVAFRVPPDEVTSVASAVTENSMSFVDMVQRAAMPDSSSSIYSSNVQSAGNDQGAQTANVLQGSILPDRSAGGYQDIPAPLYPAGYPLLPTRSDRRPSHSVEGLTGDTSNYMAGGGLSGSYFDSTAFGSRSIPDASVPSYTMQLPSYGADQQSQAAKEQSYLPYGGGGNTRMSENQLTAESPVYGHALPPPPPSSALPSDAFPKDFFGQYFPEPSLPPHATLQDQRGTGGMIGSYQQPSVVSASSHPGEASSDLFRRAYSSASDTFISVKSAAMLAPQVSPTGQPSQYWLSSNFETHHRDRVSPQLAAQTGFDVARNSYNSLRERNESLELAGCMPKRMDMTQSMFHSATSVVSRSPAFDRYALPGGAYSLTYSPPSAGPTLYTSHTIPPQSAGTSPRHLEDAYRHMTDYRTLAAAHRHHRSSALPQAADMYGNASAAALSSLDRYYYSARDAMYRSQQLAAAAAMPHAFMPKSAVTPQYVDRAAAYGRETGSSYGQPPASYGFGYSDNQYLPATPHTGKVTSVSSEYFAAGVDATSHAQDPYRHSVIYNMMPRYF